MRAINYTTARQNLAQTMDDVIQDHVPTIITRNSDKAVVMMSLEDWNAWQETFYLLRSPANARHLLESIQEFEGNAKTIVTMEELPSID